MLFLFFKVWIFNIIVHVFFLSCHMCQVTLNRTDDIDDGALATELNEWVTAAAFNFMSRNLSFKEVTNKVKF